MPVYRFGKFQLAGPNLQEIRELKQEIFDHHLYDLELDRPDPTIIDAGAHLGLASLYFKSQWPACRITLVEPLPATLTYLQQNLWQNRLDTGIKLIPAALDIKIGERRFYYDASPDRWYSTAGFTPGAWDHTQTSASVLVPTLTLDSLLTQPIDLLKLDIEGAEPSVLAACHHLDQIRHLLVEIHPPVNPNQLSRLLHPTHTVEIVNHHYGLKLLSASARIRT